MVKIMTNDYQYVDLGLPSGTLWAACNVGANKPTDCGYFLAFGESEPKESYDSINYKLICINGAIGPNYDSAHLALGGDWELPDFDQVIELKENTKISVYEVNEFRERIVKFESIANGKSIVFPLCGFKDANNVCQHGDSSYCWAKEPNGTSFGAFYVNRYGSTGNGYYSGRFGHNVRGVINVKKKNKTC